jgi:hypothetical protein
MSVGCNNEYSLNRKLRREKPKTAKTLLATATLLPSAVSFIGVGGAIPQPQQAFAQTVDQSIDQESNQNAEAGEGSEVLQLINELGSQFTNATGEDYE